MAKGTNDKFNFYSIFLITMEQPKLVTLRAHSLSSEHPEMSVEVDTRLRSPLVSRCLKDMKISNTYYCPKLSNWCLNPKIIPNLKRQVCVCLSVCRRFVNYREFQNCCLPNAGFEGCFVSFTSDLKE